MTENKIPFNKPSIAGKEIEYIIEAVRGGHASGDGPFTRKCQHLLEKSLGIPKALLTTSCTHALEMSALLLDIRPGDEVIVPSFTFVTTVNAFILRGAHPVFIDIRPDTLNMDETLLEDLISPKTKAVVPVHYAGVGCEMQQICEIAKRHGVHVVEDNAHGLFGSKNGKWLGTFGTMATLSFHETKNFICGEGGALLINDPKFIERAEIVREKGTDRSRFFRGQVDKYTWVDLGSSYLLSDLLAAYLYAQLEEREKILGIRKRIFDYYDKNLRDWAEAADVRLPIVPDSCGQSYHMFYMLLPSMEKRQAMIEHLKNKSIWSVFHYLPLHISPMGRGFGYGEGDIPVTEDISERLLRLPFYNELTPEMQSEICGEIIKASSSW
ncbi:MAG: dTDP-4-amino-4,6-dideoxygalactose transaminase [Candidatus Krumholzibacteriota bacterium]|nr:dTDP-4-amino-4,6-dideoxygalactose transaminase [Candidatus Krumholzibacteriota bacterium]